MAKGKIGIPKLSPKQHNISDVLVKVIEILETGEGQRGDPLDAKVTWKDLRDSDLVAFAGSINPNKPLSSQVVPPDPLGADPTKPANFVATATYTAIVLEWSPAAYYGHKYTEIWRSSTPNIGDAILIGQAPYSVFADVVGQKRSFYYWVRFIGTGAGNVGPYSDMVFAQTGLNVTELLSDLTGQITTSQLAASLTSRLDAIDKLTDPNSIGAKLIQEINTRTSETDALAQNITTLLGYSDDNVAAIESLQQVKADQSGVNAIYEIKLDVNGHVSGFGTVNDGEQSQFFINADTFALLPQTGAFSARNLNDDTVAVFTYQNVPMRLRQWQPNTAYLPYAADQTVDNLAMKGDVIAPRALAQAGVLYRCSNGGTSGATEPAWGGAFITDGTAEWEKITTHAGPLSPFIIKNNQVVIDSAFVRDLTGENIKAGSIGADKLNVVNLSAVSSNMGNITAGIMRSGDSRFIIDLTNGRMMIYDENSNLRVQIGKLG